MAGVHTVDELRHRLARMSPQQVRQIVRKGRLHAKLAAKRARGTATPTNLKVLEKLERTQLGI